MVDKESIDFAVSWDSLVHADRIAMIGYGRMLAKVYGDKGEAGERAASEQG